MGLHSAHHPPNFPGEVVQGPEVLVLAQGGDRRCTRDSPAAYEGIVVAVPACASLSQCILSLAHASQQVWTCAYHAIAASTTLILDIFQSSTSDPSEDVINKRLEVQAALEELKTLSDTSPIAARGVQLLSTLLAEEAKHRRTDLSSRKRKAPDPPLDHERFGDVAKRVSNSVVKVVKSPSPRSSIGNSSLPPYYAPQDSPALSDGSLTQDAFDSILLSGIGIGEQQYGPGESPGGVDTNFDFWRMLDASFEPTSQGSQGVGMSFGTDSPGAWQ